MLDLCFVIVLLIVSCHSARSVRFLRFLLFAFENLTFFRMLLQLGFRLRPGIVVIRGGGGGQCSLAFVSHFFNE